MSVPVCAGLCQGLVSVTPVIVNCVCVSRQKKQTKEKVQITIH